VGTITSQQLGDLLKGLMQTANRHPEKEKRNPIDLNINGDWF